MTSFPASSRRRFAEYLKDRRAKAAGQPAPNGQADPNARSTRRARSFITLFREFWGLVAAHRLKIGAALVTTSIATGLSLLMPASTKVAIDYIITDNPGPAGIPAWLGIPERWIAERLPLLWLLAAAMVTVTTLRIIFGLWGRWQMTRLTKRTQVGLRRRVFDHAVHLPLHRIYKLKSGGVSSILREDAGGAAELLFKMIYNPWGALLQLAGTLIVLAVVDWRMLLGSIILIPAVWWTHKTWISRIRPVFSDIRATRTGIDAHATEAFGGMRVVRGFGREGGEANRFTRGNHFMARQEILAWTWSRGIDIAWQLFIPIASTGVLIYGGWQVIEGNMTIGDVMMFTTYLLMLLGPLEMLAASATDMQTQLAGLDRVLDILAEPAEFAQTPGDIAVDRATTRGRVTITDVWFTYPGAGKEHREPAIRGVSLDVAAGETIALVGPSGSGKTTLCNLVARFYDPQQGRIELDGVDLKRIDVGSYRRLLGIVEQDVFLFDGTVAENIAYARRDATPDEIRDAAAAANAAGFIEELERGYDTLVGERGVRLSGGQKQRLAIARALLADPAILILDEATSNLDTESERLIQRSLARLMQGRTSFVIAHRLSTIRHASRIAVLEAGRIVEVGTHDELLADGGRYAQLLRLQLSDTPANEPEPTT